MNNIPVEYKLIETFDLGDINSKGMLLEHKKSGARVSVISNDDDNKVFYIGFRTTPKDSTGVAHILEHSVLCGSKKYPLKDPFVELAKGSLNTFLNAMTYPDKTVYPIASQNNKDFRNLMDVYLDAVFNPNIYENEKIFRQEGWHYETDENGDIIYNGVVYNEMKGAFSSPDDVLEREILNSLFPDNTYAFESGGDPENIPDLTYEDFLKFHSIYYHPSNSYIYLYGDMDVEENLDFLDKEYLSKYDRINPNSEISLQKPFEKKVEIKKNYPVSKGDAKSNTYFSLNYVCSDILDASLYQAFNVLDYALLNSPGAPLREALMKKSIGKDIIGGYSNGTYQPYFTIGVKGAKSTDRPKFLNAVDEALKDIVSNGIDKKALKAAINIQEFSFREADFGSYPKGLVYGLICFDSWLYNDKKPFLHLDTIPVLDDLKKKVETNYFEELVQKYLIDNNHSAIVVLNPVEELSKKRDKETKDKLCEYKHSLSKEDIEKIASDAKELKEYQATPTSNDDLRKLPLLDIDDLDRKSKDIKNRIENISNQEVIFHDINSNGITYLNLLFDIGDMKKEEIPEISFLIRMLGLLDTNKHTYAEYSNEANILTGGIFANMQIQTKKDDKVGLFVVSGAKFLKENIKETIDLILEMLLETDFSDKGRIKELLNQELSHFKMRMQSAGHLVAATRAKARFSTEGYLSEMIAGIEFYEFLKDLYENYNEKINNYIEKCKKLIKQIFKKEALMISVTGNKELTKEVGSFVPVINESLSDEPKQSETDFGVLNKKNEAFKTAAAIQYVARAGNFKKQGLEYNGALRVVKTILSYEYFWTNVRVIGGAYGCMANFKRNGDLYFVSYRDPNLQKTNDVFTNTPEFLEKFDCDKRDMTKYIIGTISSMDTPLTPAQEGDRALSLYLHDIGIEDIQKARDEVLGATVEDIRKLSEHIKVCMDSNYLTVLGNEVSIDKESSLFDEIITLI